MVPMRPPSLINASQTTFGEGGRVVVWRCGAGRGGEEREGIAGQHVHLCGYRWQNPYTSVCACFGMVNQQKHIHANAATSPAPPVQHCVPRP